MGLINNVDVVCLLPVGYGLALETSAKHHIPQATNIPSNPYSVYSPTQKNSFFSKLVFECIIDVDSL